MVTEKVKDGWTVEPDTRMNGSVLENAYIVKFNGTHVLTLADSHCARGTIPQVIVLPYKPIKELTISVGKGVKSNLKRVKGSKDYINFAGCE